MKLSQILAAAGLTLAVAGAAHAADVKVTGLHNCCGMCNRALNTTLTNAGATSINVTGKEVSFSTSEPDKVLKALFDAGFGGKVEGAKAPEAVGAKGTKVKSLKLEGLHNCCGGCTNAIQEVVKPFGASALKPRETALTITSDTEIDAEAVINALRAAGYNARIVK